MIYPYDPTGTSSSNLVSAEIHTTTQLNYNDYHLIIPIYGPFFLNNLSVLYTTVVGDTPVTTTLVEGVNYTLCLMYEAAIRSLGLPVYAGISLVSPISDGTITLNYQTMGGDFTSNPADILFKLATLVYNPKITLYDTLINKPTVWPPNPHNHDYDYVFGQGDVITAINNLVTAITEANTNLPAYIRFITRTDNPTGVTADQIGLGLVQNLPTANNVDIDNLLPVNKLITLNQLVTIFRNLNIIT